MWSNSIFNSRGQAMLRNETNYGALRRAPESQASEAKACFREEEISGRKGDMHHPDFSRDLDRERKLLERNMDTQSPFPVMYMRDMLAETMQRRLGIVRSEENPATTRISTPRPNA